MTRDPLCCLSALCLIVTAAACQQAPSPAVPSAAGNNPAPAPAQITIVGTVTDTALRPVAGVSIEAVAGGGTGAATTTNAEGRFSIAGTFDRNTRLRLSQAGYTTIEATVNCCASAQIFVQFTLPLDAVNVAIEPGVYDMTLETAPCDKREDPGYPAIPAGAVFPDALRQRTYRATVTRESATHYAVTPAEAPTYAFKQLLAVAGRYVYLDIGDYYFTRFDVTDTPDVLLEITGEARAEIESRTPLTSFELRYHGALTFCRFASARGRFEGCYNAPSRLVERTVCWSSNHRISFARR